MNYEKMWHELSHEIRKVQGNDESLERIAQAFLEIMEKIQLKHSRKED